MAVGVGHRRERNPVMKQKRNQNMKINTARKWLKLMPLRWRRARAKPPTPQKNMDKARALAVGSQQRAPKAAMDGHIGRLGVPAVGILNPGMTTQLGTRDLDDEYPLRWRIPQNKNKIPRF